MSSEKYQRTGRLVFCSLCVLMVLVGVSIGVCFYAFPAGKNFGLGVGVERMNTAKFSQVEFEGTFPHVLEVEEEEEVVVEEEEEEEEEEEVEGDDVFRFPKGKKNVLTKYLRRKYLRMLKRMKDGEGVNIIATENIGGFGNTLNGFDAAFMYCLFEDCVVAMNSGLGWRAPNSDFFTLYEALDKDLGIWMAFKNANNPFRKAALAAGTRKIVRSQWDGAHYHECFYTFTLCGLLVKDDTISVQEIEDRINKKNNRFASHWNVENPSPKTNIFLSYKTNKFTTNYIILAKNKLRLVCEKFLLCYGDSGGIGFQETKVHRSVYEDYEFFYHESEQDRAVRVLGERELQLEVKNMIPRDHTIRELFFGFKISGNVFTELFTLISKMKTTFEKFWEDHIEGKFLVVLQMRNARMNQKTFARTYDGCVTNTLERIANDYAVAGRRKTVEIVLYVSVDEVLYPATIAKWNTAFEDVKKSYKEQFDMNVVIMTSEVYLTQYFDLTAQQINEYKTTNAYELGKKRKFQESAIWDFELFARSDLGISIHTSSYTQHSSGHNKKFYPAYIIGKENNPEVFNDAVRVCHVK